jgi:hypothetical protein
MSVAYRADRRQDPMPIHGTSPSEAFKAKKALDASQKMLVKASA